MTTRPSVAAPKRKAFRISVITTGGTVAKTYDQRAAVMRNTGHVVERLVRSLRLEGARVIFQDLMHKDSLDLDERDRTRIVKMVLAAARKNHAVVVIHGTDTLAQTGEALVARTTPVPIVLTGAMVPLVVLGSDGPQNITEALFACRLLAPGVYAVFHGRALAFPGVVKDRDALTFVRASNHSTQSGKP